MSRTQIKQVGPRDVTITTTDGQVRRFWIPQTTSGDAYVRECTDWDGRGHDCQDRQVCYAHGGTMRASPATLLSSIREWWRRA